MSDEKECFFIAPIDSEGSEIRERSNKVMEYIIQEAVSKYGYSVTRADQMDQPGSITNQVIEKTVNSELVIADLTGHNPNVFYELAVRHATGKPYIQLIKSTETIPFDISDLRTIQYGLKVDEADQAKDQIQALLESVKDEEPEFDNPISASAEMRSLRESADPADKNLAEILQTMYKLDNRMEDLENMVDPGSKSIQKNKKQAENTEAPPNQSLSQQEQEIFTIMIDLEQKNQGPVSKEEVVKIAEDSGINEDEVEDKIRDLMMSEHIYLVDDGVYRTV